mmetsp:Transcript_292/g.715  ORF Transcript_292/g.715 Transcript_292/m.715 type:complete len:282 (-) Transcript_292:500-1345(-)
MKISTSTCFLLTSSFVAFDVTTGFSVGSSASQKTAGALNLRTTSQTSPSSALYVNVPRLELPEVLSEKLDDYGLKNPNEMTEQEYKDYSGAAILGTLVFFLVPGALLTGTYSDIVTVLQTVILDFVISATVGGGAAIYLSLKDDETGEKVRDLGNTFLSKAKDLTGLPTLRYDLPEQVTDVVEGQLGLLSPNDMSESDYDGYSGAAVAGTLAFFLLPGAVLTGGADVLGAFFAAAVINFAISALIGGGAAIFLSLRDDEIAKTVNLYGGGFLDKVDEVLEG